VDLGSNRTVREPKSPAGLIRADSDRWLNAIFRIHQNSDGFAAKLRQRDKPHIWRVCNGNDALSNVAQEMYGPLTAMVVVRRNQEPSRHARR
jgi:hypothetical protein